MFLLDRMRNFPFHVALITLTTVINPSFAHHGAALQHLQQRIMSHKSGQKSNHHPRQSKKQSFKMHPKNQTTRITVFLAIAIGEKGYISPSAKWRSEALVQQMHQSSIVFHFQMQYCATTAAAATNNIKTACWQKKNGERKSILYSTQHRLCRFAVTSLACSGCK